MSLQNLLALPSLATVSYRVGRWIMFNIGFKDFIEKLEEYFGRGVTKFGVGLLGIAILLFAVGFAVNASVYPLALWLGAIVTGQPAVSDALNGISTVATVVWLVVVLALVVSYFQHRRELNHSTELLAEIRTLQTDIEKQEDATRGELQAMMVEAKSTVERANALVEEAEMNVVRAEEALALVTKEDAAPIAPKRRRKTAEVPV